MLIQINRIDENQKGVNFTVINTGHITNYSVHDCQVLISYVSTGCSTFGFDCNEHAATFALALSDIMVNKIRERKSSSFRIKIIL